MRVVVIGGGPAGVSAALHAAELGAEVTLLERGRVGGTALNSGPAPVRTLARAARLVRDWSSWETFGLRGPRPEVDVAATLANAQRVAGYLYERKRVADHIRSVGVDLVEEAGDVRFVDADTVAAADGRTWTADRIIIAVGGKPGRLPIPGAELALTYEDLRSLTSLPERVCVIGAADTGCQLTSILADFGCDVTLVEYAPRIVPGADVDVSVALEHAFRGRGIEVITSAAVHQLEALQPGVRVLYRVGGTSPLTVASGKKRAVLARHVRNRRLYDAIDQWAFCALNSSPGARAFYDQRRTAGDLHHQALRALGNRLVGILHGCLRHRTHYDEHKAWAHRQNNPVNKAA